MATAAITQTPSAEGTYIPAVPQTLEEANVNSALIESLILKALYIGGEMVGRDLATGIGLKFSLISDTISFLRQHHFIGVKRSLGMGDISSVFFLSEQGVQHARAALEKNQYSGRAPVTLQQYTKAVLGQRQLEQWLTVNSLASAYDKVLIEPKTLSQLGRAVNSGRSLLIYGQPGNGKTYLAETLLNIESSDIYVPYAIEFQGQIVRVFDPVYHHRVDDVERSQVFEFEYDYDARWVRCRRPFIVTGGELTLSMLDLSYDHHTKIYDAPFQLKANNGIYLIDDFGRQQVTPVEVLNRWIIPMEQRVDYLSFCAGGKMIVPFESFVIFSTNLTPAKLGDEAFLRRIKYKMHLKNPSAEEFVRLFLDAAHSRRLHPEPAMIETFIEKYYRWTGKPSRRCQPRDLLSHAVDLINFEQRPYELNDDVLSQAFESCFGSLDDSDESIQ